MEQAEAAIDSAEGMDVLLQPVARAGFENEERAARLQQGTDFSERLFRGGEASVPGDVVGNRWGVG